MISRYFLSFNLAALITFASFFAMQWLISSDEIVLIESTERPPMKWDIVRKPEPIKTRERLPEPVVVEKAPEVDFTPQVRKGENPTPIVDLGTNPTDTIQKPIEINFLKVDGVEQPIVRVSPQYPSGPLSKGIEGYVIIEFTVTAQGNTTDVIAIEASHRGFVRNAIRAVEKFKYKPKIVDGEALPVLGLATRITFTLEK